MSHMRLVCPIRVPLRVPYVSLTCPFTCPVPRMCPPCMSTVKKTYSQYLAEELGGQEEGDSEGPATKKYRSMVTTDRASFDKETAGFIGNWWGEKDSVAAGIKAEWKKTLRNGTGNTEEGAAATAEA